MFLPLPLILVEEALEAGVEGLRVDGVEGVEREEELAWALIFERRWVMALGVTSGWVGVSFGCD